MSQRDDCLFFNGCVSQVHGLANVAGQLEESLMGNLVEWVLPNDN
jgi:hypothetical protein